MNNINAKELKQRMDLGEKMVLVNALEESKFRMKHIPGSLNLFTKEAIASALSKDDCIVVYCTDIACNKSVLLYYLLETMGYNHLFRFAGGLREWENEGFSLAGDMVKTVIDNDRSQNTLG